jgi:hypothetical protein
MSRRAVVGLFVAVAVLMASCGDDSDSSSPDTVAEAAGAPDDGGSDDGSPSDVGEFFTGDCAEALGAYNGALASAGAAFTPGGVATPEDTAELLDGVAEAAPEEIADDFAVLAEAYGEFAQALADAGVDFNDPASLQDPEAIAALQSLGDIFNEQELNQASDNIQAWFDANCG